MKNRALCSVLRAACFALCAAEALPVLATTYYVDAENGDDGYDGTAPDAAKLTIEAGIKLLTANNDELVLAPGTYSVTNDETVLPAKSGLVIRGSDPDPSNTVLTGHGEMRGFKTSQAQHFRNLTFRHFLNPEGKRGAALWFATFNTCSISNCHFYANTNLSTAAEQAGAIYASSLPPMIVDSVFERNVSPSSRGGAICHTGTVGSNMILSNCVFRANTAKSGGAVYFNKSMAPRAYSCLFAGNSATSGGGAMAGPGTWTDCIFTNNSAASGGAALNTAAITFRNCQFVDNVATNLNGSGGGAFCNDNIRGSKFFDCTFLRNVNMSSAKGGGAICAVTVNCSAPGNWVDMVSNCTFRANVSSNYAGGAVWGLVLETKDCVFEGNRAKNNGGAVELADSYSTTVHTSTGVRHQCVSNCVFRFNETFGTQRTGGAGALDVNIQTNFTIGGCDFICNACTNYTLGGNNTATAVAVGGAVVCALPIYLHDCNFVSNAAVNAGGAFFGVATGGVLRCRFESNRADCDEKQGSNGSEMWPAAGSAIAFERGTTDLANPAENCWWNFVEDCVFTNNFCRGNGPTVYATRGGLRIRRCVFTCNEGRVDNKGIYYFFASGTVSYNPGNYLHYRGAASGTDYTTYAPNRTIFQIEDCVFKDNVSAGFGGAINAYYLSHFDDRHPKSFIRNCLFQNTTHCKAGLDHAGTFKPYDGCGGAILLGPTGEVTVENCTFTGNSSEGAGGAIYNPGATNRIVNCVFHGNTDDISGRDSDNLAVADVTKVDHTFAPDDGVLTDGVNGCIVSDGNPFRSDGHCDLALRGSSGAGAGLVLDWMTASSTDLGGKPRTTGGAVDFGCYQLWFKPGLLMFVK